MTSKLSEAHATIGQIKIPRNWYRCVIRIPEVSSDMRILMQASGHMVIHKVEEGVTVIELIRIRMGDDGSYFYALMRNISKHPEARIEFIEKESSERGFDERGDSIGKIPFASIAHQTKRFLGKILGGAE